MYQLLQSMVIRADILVVAVLHSEAAGYGSQLDEAKSLIEMTCMSIALDNRIELQNFESVLLTLVKTVKNKLLAYMTASKL